MLFPTQTESLEVISQTIVLADFTLNVIVLDVLKQGKFQFLLVAHIQVLLLFYVSNLMNKPLHNSTFYSL